MTLLDDIPSDMSVVKMLSSKKLRKKVSSRSVLQSVLQELAKSASQECATGVPYKSVPQKCLTRVFQKSTCYKSAIVGGHS